MQCLWIVSDHGKATAFFRSVFGKGRDYHVAARANRSHDLLDIGTAVGRMSQEMKHRAVMPDVESVHGEYRANDIALHPVHGIGMFTQSLLCNHKGCRRKVIHRHVAVPFGDKVIHQFGRATSDIDNGHISAKSCFVD